MARLIGQKLSERLGQQFIIENHAGAAGNIGMGAAARAPGDGYTILFVSSSYVVNPSLYLKAPYDPDKDFVPITKAAAATHALIAHPSVPARDDERAGRGDQGRSEEIQRRLARHRHDAVALDRAVQAVARTERPAGRAVRGRQSIDPVGGRGPHAALVPGDPARDRADQGRQAARARRHLAEARRRAARRADARGARHQGPGSRDHAGRARAGRHAEGDRGPAAAGDRRDPAKCRT